MTSFVGFSGVLLSLSFLLISHSTGAQESGCIMSSGERTPILPSVDHCPVTPGFPILCRLEESHNRTLNTEDKN